MTQTLRPFLQTALTSYWFLPSLMALGAAALSFGAVSLDQVVDLAWLETSPWLYASTPDGARSALSTIAGSAITVAGVAFSITTVAVAQTAARYGPRLLTNFMRDRGNQITLGTLIGTFLYSLLVLRSVRGADEELSSFVPHIAVLVAFVLAFASLAVLIYFLHHVPESLHISNIVARLGHSLDGAVEGLFPTRIGQGPRERGGDGGGDRADGAGRAGAWRPEDAAPVRMDRNGYIVSVDAERLMRHARANDLVLRLERRPGDFVRKGEVIAYARPAARADEAAADGVRAAFAVGAYRGEAQDAMYLVDRLVEVAAKALSPGINDVFTATNALDWLAAALAKIAGREAPAALRHDKQGRLRVIARPYTFEDFTDAAFDRLRPYVESDRTAAVEMMGAIANVARAAETEEQRRALLTHAAALREGCAGALGHERDRQAVEAQYRVAVRLLQGGAETGPARAAAEEDGGGRTPVRRRRDAGGQR